MGVDVLIRTLYQPTQVDIDLVNEKIRAAGFDDEFEQLRYYDGTVAPYRLYSSLRAYYGDNTRYYHSWPHISELLLIVRKHLPDNVVLYGNDTHDFDDIEAFEPVTVEWLAAMWTQWRKGEGVN